MSELEDPQEQLLITGDEFTRLLGVVRESALRELASKPEHVTPMLFVQSVMLGAEPELTLCSLCVPFNEGFEKRSALSGIGRKFYEEGKLPLAVFLCSEAWFAPSRPGVQPRDCPDRREVILVFGLSLGRRFSAIISIPVRRDEANRMVPDGDAIESLDGKPTLLDAFYAGFFSAVAPGVSPGGAQ